MEIISNQSELFRKAIGKQIFSSDYYRKFSYVYITDYLDSFLLYNCLSCQMIVLTKEEFNDFESCNNSSVVEKLVENWFLVPDNNDDEKLKDQYLLMIAAFGKNSAIDTYVILPTMNCNARCFYCFEHGSRRYSMTDKTALDVADFIIERSLGQKINIQWFGGEPLYNLPAINAITNRLIDANQNYTSRMISNGYLFDQRTIKLAKEKWNMESVQITLDGLENTYNKAKNYIYKDCESPFKRVINNIGLLLDSNIKVIVRINLDTYNCDELYCLVDFLNEKFGKHKKNFTIYAWMLYDNRGLVKSIKGDEERHSLTKKLIELENYIYELGLGTKRLPKSKVVLESCFADSDNSTIILPDGHLGKCDHHSDDEFWGSIYDKEVNKELIKSWKEKRASVALCKTCPLVPQCNHLKKCPDEGGYECDEFVQMHRLSKLRRQMINLYENYLNQ